MAMILCNKSFDCYIPTIFILSSKQYRWVFIWACWVYPSIISANYCCNINLNFSIAKVYLGHLSTFVASTYLPLFIKWNLPSASSTSRPKSSTYLNFLITHPNLYLLLPGSSENAHPADNLVLIYVWTQHLTSLLLARCPPWFLHLGHSPTPSNSLLSLLKWLIPPHIPSAYS